jgi:SET domain-containing protein
MPSGNVLRSSAYEQARVRQQQAHVKRNLQSVDHIKLQSRITCVVAVASQSEARTLKNDCAALIFTFLDAIFRPGGRLLT